MARPKYEITAADVTNAKSYLQSKLRNYRIELGEDVSYYNAEQEFLKAGEEKRKEKRAELVNAWCEKYLSSQEWYKLKLAIRKRRERLKRHNDLKTVTISARAFELLSKLATRDDVTYTEVLEHYLPKALNVGRGRAPKRR